MTDFKLVLLDDITWWYNNENLVANILEESEKFVLFAINTCLKGSDLLCNNSINGKKKPF